MKILIFFLILFISNSFHGQLNSEKTKLIQPLMDFDYAEGKSIGIAGTKSELYSYFESIKESLNNNELKILSKNASNSLRFYSCLELMKRNSEEIILIYEYYKEYPLKMKYTNNCIESKIELADYIFRYYNNIFTIKKEAELKLQQLSKDNKDYIIWKNILENSQKEITPKMLEIFEKIKLVKN